MPIKAFMFPVQKNKGGAVCFLWHFPSPFGDRAFPGALPCGVRTFLKGVTFAIVRLSSFKYYTVKLKFSNIIKQLTFLPGNFKRRHKKRKRRWDLNPQPPRLKPEPVPMLIGNALPMSSAYTKKMEKALGLEPPTSPITIGVLCL